jgi:hypothetical protein
LGEQFSEPCTLASAPNASRLTGVPAMRIAMWCMDNVS